MRLVMIRAGVAAAAALALAACAGHSSVVPPPTNGLDAGAQGISLLQPLALTTCAKMPPQYEWIFKGACNPNIKLVANGIAFTLGTYDDITIKGSIGKNNAKGTVIVALADATGNGDIEAYKGKAFPKYKGEGATFVYATAVNQSSQTIKPVAVKGKPVLQYIITDSKGLPGKTCGAAVLTEGSKGSLQWAALPGTYAAKGNTVTITQYNVPQGFEFPPKIPLYFAVNCYNK